MKNIFRPLFSFSTIPIINLKNFNPSTNRTHSLEISKQILSASNEYGAFYISDPKINIISMQKSMNDFFKLDQNSKNSIKITTKGKNRGYIGIGEESGSDLVEVKEAFSYGYEWLTKESVLTNPLTEHNIWPKQPLDFKTNMINFYSEMCELSKNLTSAFSLALGFDEKYLPSFCNDGDKISLMRLFHYFPYDKISGASQNKIGSSPHTDWGFLTLIIQQEDVTGLQIWHEEQWKDVPSLKNTVVVNCGDYLSLISDGKLKSPLHRVVSDGRERYSSVLFYYPNYDAKIPKLNNKADLSLFKNQVEGGKEKEFNLEKMSFGEYIGEKWVQVSRTGKTY